MDVASLASGILNFAGNKLASKILEEFGSTLGVEKSLDELKEIVEGIKSILQNVEDKLIKNDPSLNWLKKLKHVAYDIDDLLNEFYLEAEKHNAKIEGGKHVMIKCFFEKPNSILFRHKMAIQIKTIKGRFREILSSITDFNTIRNSLPTDPIQDRQLVTREASLFPIVDETKIFGRDQDKSNIIRKLIETNDREALPVISIIGIGGLGKTSLAKLVFNDENEIKKHFEVRIWVYVSSDFLVEKLIGKLFEAIIQKKSEFETVQFMIKRISEKLTGKRFLLVLDDVWNKDQHKWDQFILHIKGGAAGSRILLTTRNQEVVDTVKSIPYNLEPLSKDDSWKLFQQSSQKVEKDLDSDFIDIGKGIVMKCGGVPLAVRTVGSIVGGKKEINSWLAVRDCELWNVENGVFTSLMLSYSYLPSYLQQCFLYCSIFPKGYAIKKHHLIDEWIAHGFITLTNDIEQLEDVGNEYFDSLLKMWFLQDLDEDEDNGTVTCKMHDLVHDLARYILQKEIVSIPKKITNDSATICRYLSLTRCTEKIDRKLINKVRSLYVDRGNFTFDKPIKKARHLRILILEDVYTISLSPFILKLEHLGCLRVSSLQCEALPEVISCCWNLQALHVINCRRLATLPKLIGKLKKLRTLDLSGAEELECLPESIGDCCNLQSLHLIGCKSLKEIPNSIGQNKNIRMLNLSDCGSLKELPSESFGMLQNIQSINLHRCSSIKELPNSIIQLGKLHSINLSYCSRLVYLPEGIINLMKLKVLNLKGCEKLHGLPVRIRQLTRLQTLGLFVAGDGRKYAKMSELRSINMINGDLKI